MLLYVDVPWLLDVQEGAVPEDVSIADYSALVAAVARHRTKLPTLAAADPDAAWRAAALLHTIVRLEPLPQRNSWFAALVAAQYMGQSGEGIDPPYGALPELVRKIQTGGVTLYDVAEQLRLWRI
ncbi:MULTISPECIES: toxin Doc [unclassified Streptomyces]|uniref:toxin Doc n=1 Tax=unclassified Streptomyces TaxID=2593676 RepID=UPI00136BDCEE|nr:MULTISPECIES: toxin Doc [unclassified Streptomyces]MYV52121.1 toxin Doc [Streptomyces sp. SID3212]WSJ47584.1 toxin Doc [Streptomyces sp. NBC_01317]